MGDKRGRGKLPIMHCRTGQTDFHAECWEFESEYDWQNWLCGLHEPITPTPVSFFFYTTPQSVYSARLEMGKIKSLGNQLLAESRASKTKQGYTFFG